MPQLAINDFQESTKKRVEQPQYSIQVFEKSMSNLTNYISFIYFLNYELHKNIFFYKLIDFSVDFQNHLIDYLTTDLSAHGPAGITMQPPMVFWEWYINIVNWTPLIKKQDVNTPYLESPPLFWMVFQMVVMKKDKLPISM